MSCFRVQPVTFVCFDIGIHIWHMVVHASPCEGVSRSFMIPMLRWHLIWRSNIADTALKPIQLIIQSTGQSIEVKFKIFDMALRAGHRFFVIWQSHTILAPYRCVAHFHVLCMILASISKFYFKNEFVSGQDRLCSLIWRKIWHMGVLSRDNMLCTFMTSVWPWLLTYMWVVGDVLS